MGREGGLLGLTSLVCAWAAATTGCAAEPPSRIPSDLELGVVDGAVDAGRIEPPDPVDAFDPRCSAPKPNGFCYVSTGGDAVGGDLSRTYQYPTGYIQSAFASPGGWALDAWKRDPTGADIASFWFIAPNPMAIAVGDYPYAVGGKPVMVSRTVDAQMLVAIDGRNCPNYDSEGSFQVVTMVRNMQNYVVEAVVNFQQVCQGTGIITGQVAYMKP